MPRFPVFHYHSPLSSYRCGKSVRVVRYGRALGAVNENAAWSGRNPDQSALHVLRIAVATTLAVGEAYQNERFRDTGEAVVRRVQGVHVE